jgi:hypothetical protein
VTERGPQGQVGETELARRALDEAGGACAEQYLQRSAISHPTGEIGELPNGALRDRGHV